MIRRNKGKKLGRKLIRVYKWITRKRGKQSKYHRLEAHTSSTTKNRAIAKLCKWGRSFRRGLFSAGDKNYIRVGHNPDFDVPKGHLTVSVGERGEDIQRVVVPILFLNHPLFGELLREAEEVFGFHHSGQITIPCPISEFENVQNNIAAGEKFRQGIRCL